MQFEHVGIISQTKPDGANYSPDKKLWITDYRDHPYRVEWLCFEPDSPVAEEVRTNTHVGFRVDNLAEASKGMKVLVEPFDIGRGVVAFYQTDDGAVIELMQFKE